MAPERADGRIRARVFAYLPIVLSLLGLALITEFLVKFGFDRTRYPTDEGLEAHLWQLLMGSSRRSSLLSSFSDRAA